MIKYLFQLGRERALASAELEVVLPEEAQIKAAIDNYVLVQAPEPLLTINLQNQLGGTVQISRVLDEMQAPADLNELIARLVSLLAHAPGRNFALSWIKSKDATQSSPSFDSRNLGLAVKRELASQGIRRRLVTDRSGQLQSIVIHDQLLPPKGTGLNIIEIDSGARLIAQIETVQNVRDLSQRDYDRPARDPRRGMLPPKLARIMVNLAAPKSTETLLDPFCGVGTVLMEAALLGCPKLIGADRDASAIQASRLNFTWLRKKLGITVQPRWIISDILTLKQKLDRPVDIIVTEADLGPANIGRRSPVQRVTAMRELRGRYELWLKALADLVSPGGRVILAYPDLRRPQFSLNLEPLAQSVGFKLLGPTLDYARPDQLIGRRILRLKRH